MVDDTKSSVVYLADKPLTILRHDTHLALPRLQGVKKVVLVSSIASITSGWTPPAEGHIVEPETKWSDPEK